jgi:hypothetical protein
MELKLPRIIDCNACLWPESGKVVTFKLGNNNLYYAVECSRPECMARGPARRTEADAIVAWNKL